MIRDLLFILAGFLFSQGLAQEAATFPSSLSAGGYAQRGIEFRMHERSVFKDHFGYTSSMRWAKAQHGAIPLKEVWSSDAMRAYRSATLPEAVHERESSLAISTKAHNKAFAESLVIKGNLAEKAMDDFYKRGGWEKIEGKRGVNGFDGLYCKRRPDGTISEWMVTDAKSGSSKLVMTKHGKQLSPEWIKYNLTKLIEHAQAECRLKPTPENQAYLNVLKELNGLNERGLQPKVRVFSMKLRREGDSVICVRANLDANGNPIPNSHPMEVDLNSTSSEGSLLRRNFYKDLAENFRACGVKNPKKLTTKIQTLIANGKISNDADFSHAITQNLHNKQLEKKVIASLGLQTEVQASKAAAASSRFFAYASKSANVLSKSLALVDPVGTAIGATIGKAQLAVEGYFERRLAEGLARRMGEETGKKLATTFAKAAGGTFMAGVSVVFFAHTYSQYQNGEISKQQLIVEGTATAVGTAGGLIALYAGSGSVAGPIGAGVGAACALFVLAHDLYASYEREQRLEKEIQNRLDWEHKTNNSPIETRIKYLQEESSALREAGIRQLTSTAN